MKTPRRKRSRLGLKIAGGVVVGTAAATVAIAALRHISSSPKEKIVQDATKPLPEAPDAARPAGEILGEAGVAPDARSAQHPVLNVVRPANHPPERANAMDLHLPVADRALRLYAAEADRAVVDPGLLLNPAVRLAGNAGLARYVTDHGFKVLLFLSENVWTFFALFTYPGVTDAIRNTLRWMAGDQIALREFFLFFTTRFFWNILIPLVNLLILTIKTTGDYRILRAQRGELFIRNLTGAIRSGVAENAKHFFNNVVIFIIANQVTPIPMAIPLPEAAVVVNPNSTLAEMGRAIYKAATALAKSPTGWYAALSGFDQLTAIPYRLAAGIVTIGSVGYRVWTSDSRFPRH